MAVPLRQDHSDRIALAQISLDGLSVGDAFGQRFFGYGALAEQVISQRKMPPSPWPYTDDTIMGLSVFETLGAKGDIDQDHLAGLFAAKHAADHRRGYGGGAMILLPELADGADWRRLSPYLFNGMGSMGNGGAMRAGPIGAYFSDDLAQVVKQARLSAEVTHAHPEGQAGAVAVAIAAAVSTAGPSSSDEVFDAVISYTPDSETRVRIEKAAALSPDSDVATAVAELGNGSQVISQDTVPFCLWCAARHPEDFQEAMWTTVSGLGDRDTTCAIVGSIVALRDGGQSIPAKWLKARESLSSLAGIGTPA